ncbi:hypothetical protein GXY_03693 [Novacetimonas hansenii ATCC 23769]|uniref:Uncharacterized protein n=1 Tax=Novacetimonas hansenii ATCC 23769 TaxID=714995 RepID=D5QC88_NOVHA|nr:hypothetical protein GXY_03693 [Novacetimonas hansenii ATCC 23769]
MVGIAVSGDVLIIRYAPPQACTALHHGGFPSVTWDGRS